MFVYKMNVLEELKKAGWSSYALLKRKNADGKMVLGSSQVTFLKQGKVVGINALDTICRLLDKQPGDIIEYIPDDRYVALKKSGYFDQIGIPTPPLEEKEGE